MAFGNKKTVGIVVFSLIVIFTLIWFAKRLPPNMQSGEAGPKYGLVRAKDGEFPSTLPREFIFGLSTTTAQKESKTAAENEKIQATESYSIRYPGTLFLQSTGSYESQESMNKLIAMYESFLTNGGWTITNKTAYNSSRGLYARKGADEASIVIIDRGDTRYVSVNYLSR